MRSVPTWTGRPAVAMAALATLILSGCADTVKGSGQVQHPIATSPSVDFPSATSATASSPAVPSSTTAPAPPPPTRTVTRDITDVQYTVPSGWQRSTNYYEVIPLETTFRAKYLIPSGVTPGLDVISIVLYRLPAAHLVDTRAQQVLRVRAYNAKRSVVIKRKLEDTVVGGRAGFDESVVQPGDRQDYRYATWFVFGGSHLVQISCQVESQVAAVATGCQKLLNSITFS